MSDARERERAGGEANRASAVSDARERQRPDREPTSCRPASWTRQSHTILAGLSVNRGANRP